MIPEQHCLSRHVSSYVVILTLFKCPMTKSPWSTPNWRIIVLFPRFNCTYYQRCFIQSSQIGDRTDYLISCCMSQSYHVLPFPPWSCICSNVHENIVRIQTISLALNPSPWQLGQSANQLSHRGFTYISQKHILLHVVGNLWNNWTTHNYCYTLSNILSS